MAICRKLLTPGRVYRETSVTSSVSLQQRPMLRRKGLYKSDEEKKRRTKRGRRKKREVE